MMRKTKESYPLDALAELISRFLSDSKYKCLKCTLLKGVVFNFLRIVYSD
jgi:hypothetical protein